MAAGDERSVGWRQVLFDGAGGEPAVERDLAWLQPELVQPGTGLSDKLVLVGRSDLGGDRQDQTAGAAAGVLAQLGVCMTVPNSVG